MKTSLLKISSLIFLLIVLPVTITPSTLAPAEAAEVKQKKITTQDIRKIIDNIMAASKKRNVEGVMKYTAPNFIAESVIQAPSGPIDLTYNRDDYRQALEQTFSITQSYNVSYKNLKVTIAPDGQSATATYEATESGIVNGTSLSVQATASTTFQIVNGNILATYTKSNANY